MSESTVLTAARRFLGGTLLICCVTACDSGSDDTAADQGVAADAFVEAQIVCDPVTKRAEREAPYTCAGEPEWVTVSDGRHTFDIFAYEASHPSATDETAFPCEHEDLDGDGLADRFKPPAVDAEPCSLAGVRPWHSVKHSEAKTACESIGWRLCDAEELGSACAGEDETPYPASQTLESGQCNLRSAYMGELAPGGTFSECTAGNGTYDLNGNLWEWSAKRDSSDGSVRYYQGAGYTVIAQQHQDQYLTCSYEIRLPNISARSFASETVGFRCCRDSQ